ncbi:MAG TPA: hypothetical protein VFJ20_03860 [Gemmatimonadaceae bacterium]|nr:hypothetical protein [Gemmatimonadaceae bacterium]
MIARWLSAVLVAAVLAPMAHAQRPTPCELVQQPGTRLTVDSLPGQGQVVFVGGAVLFKCRARGITLKGDSAEQFADHDQMIGHAVYDEPRFHVTADFLNYFPTDERVVGAGNVHARMANGSTLDGPQAEYLRAVPRVRPKAQMKAIARPTINILEKDSAGKPLPPTVVVANTVFVDGDSASLIYGGGQVTITRPDMSASGDSAMIDEDKEFMHLMRGPKLTGKKDRPFTLTGDLIDLFSKNRKLQRVIARAHATAVSDSMTLHSDTIDLRVKNELLDHAYAWGATSRARVVSPSQNMIADSLDVSMPGQRVQLVRALNKAFAEGKPDTIRFIVDKPDTTDWLTGDTIVAKFDSAVAPKDTSRNPRINQLVASGNASSLYHMAPNDSSERRAAVNYVTARIITIDFDSNKVSNKVAMVTTVDSVTGVLIEPRADSTKRRANAAQPAPPAPGARTTPPPKTPPQKSPATPKPGTPPVATPASTKRPPTSP